MEEMLEVYCRNTDTKLLVRSGLDMLGVADFAGMKNTENILGVCVNNKVQNLNYRIICSEFGFALRAVSIIEHHRKGLAAGRSLILLKSQFPDKMKQSVY